MSSMNIFLHKNVTGRTEGVVFALWLGIRKPRQKEPSTTDIVLCGDSGEWDKICVQV